MSVASSYSMVSFVLRIAVVLWLVSAYSQQLMAQSGTDTLRVVAVWQADSIDLGRPTTLVLTMRRPFNTRVQWPDSAKGYDGYEFVKQRLVSATLPGGKVQDSLFVDLRTWQIDSIQYVQLPISYIHLRDTTVVQTSKDSIFFSARVVPFSPTLPLRPDLDWALIEIPFNWAGFFLVLSCVISLGIAAYFLLRRPVRKWLSRRRLRREYAKLLLELDSNEPRLSTDPLAYINHLNALWKAYLDQDWRLALRSLTSKEVALALRTLPDLDSELRQLLTELCAIEDQVNYAGKELPASKVQQAYSRLRQFLADTLARRLATYR